MGKFRLSVEAILNIHKGVVFEKILKSLIEEVG